MEIIPHIIPRIKFVSHRTFANMDATKANRVSIQQSRGLLPILNRQTYLFNFFLFLFISSSSVQLTLAPVLFDGSSPCSFPFHLRLQLWERRPFTTPLPPGPRQRSQLHPISPSNPNLLISETAATPSSFSNLSQIWITKPNLSLPPWLHTHFLKIISLPVKFVGWNKNWVVTSAVIDGSSRSSIISHLRAPSIACSSGEGTLGPKGATAPAAF